MCDEVGGSAIYKMCSICLGQIFWKHLFLWRFGIPRLLCLGKKREDGDGWKAKCHNSLLVIASENKTIHGQYCIARMR